MARSAEDLNLGYCSSGFHHLDHLAEPRALALKGWKLWSWLRDAPRRTYGQRPWQ